MLGTVLMSHRSQIMPNVQHDEHVDNDALLDEPRWHASRMADDVGNVGDTGGNMSSDVSGNPVRRRRGHARRSRIRM